MKYQQAIHLRLRIFQCPSGVYRPQQLARRTSQSDLSQSSNSPVSDSVTDNANWSFALIDSWCTKKDDGIIKDNTIFSNRI
jgi:hypothetical protein